MKLFTFENKKQKYIFIVVCLLSIFLGASMAHLQFYLKSGDRSLSNVLFGKFKAKIPPDKCNIVNGEVLFAQRNQIESPVNKGVIIESWNVSIPNHGNFSCNCDNFFVSPHSKNIFVCVRGNKKFLFRMSCFNDLYKPWNWDDFEVIERNALKIFLGQTQFDPQSKAAIINCGQH